MHPKPEHQSDERVAALSTPEGGALASPSPLGAPAYGLNSAHILALQRSAGNQAVARRIAATTRVVQRAKEFNKAGVGAGNSAPIFDFVEALDKATEKAYQYVLHVPDLGMLRNLDGHTSWWAELWDEHQQQLHPTGMPAAFGYAIESLATHIASPYRPASPQGLSVLTQQRRGGTNPDLLLMDDSDDVAWIDLTSDAQAAHIYTGKVGWTQANLGGIHVAEISYPAMRLGDFVPTPGYADDFDKAEYLKRSHFGKILTGWRRAAWRELGKQARFKPQPTSRDFHRNQVERPRNLYAAIAAYFGTPPADDREAASILMAMDKGTAPYYLTRSGTRAQGEAFLIRHDPHLPTLAIPADGLPRPVTLSEDELALLADAWQQEGAAASGPEPVVIDEPSDELAMEEVDQQQIVSVASYDFSFQGVPQINPQMLFSLGELLDRAGFSLAVDLQSGGDRLSFIAGGATFAEDIMRTFQDFAPLSQAVAPAPALIGGRGDQEREEPQNLKRKWQGSIKLVQKVRRVGDSQFDQARLQAQNALAQFRLMLTDK